MQGFNWECSHRRDPAWYSVLASRAHEMKDAGITAVWLPPPSASVSTEVRSCLSLLDFQTDPLVCCELFQVFRSGVLLGLPRSL